MAGERNSKGRGNAALAARNAEHGDVILADRGAEYGAFEDNAEITAAILAEIRGPLPLSDVVLEEMAHMIAHKASRIFVGGRLGDSLVDAELYLRLGLQHSAGVAGAPFDDVIRRDAAPAVPFWQIIDRTAPPADLSTEPAMADWLRLLRLLTAVRLALHPADHYWRLQREARIIGIEP